MDEKTLLLDSVKKGLIDETIKADEKLVPQLLFNDPLAGINVRSTIINELKNCDEFMFNVAFLTEAGHRQLFTILEELEEKGVKGTIIVSTYTNFTQPAGLEKMLKHKNIDLRVVEDKYAMHTKGYIFRKGDQYSVIVGSSNLTPSALAKNQEWNVILRSFADGEYTRKVLAEFNRLYEMSVPVTDEFIEQYKITYNKIKEIERQGKAVVEGKVEVVPNKMQIKALENLRVSREEGHTKGLLISATGSGKTYLSAFDAKAFKPKKLLFVVHREKIVKDARKTFERVFGNTIKTGLMTQGNRSDKDFVFAMVQTLSRDNILHSYKPDEFDYIVFDECHRMRTSKDPKKMAMYQKVYDYFKPKFMLGMTATPERTDGGDIYKYFDHNVVYEIRLKDAIDNDLICDFHYYGIEDFIADGEVIDEKSSFAKLVSDQRVKHVIDAAEKYGFSGNRLKGLIFVSRVEEAIELSKLFNETYYEKAGRNYQTVALAGCNSEEEREDAIDRLEKDEGSDVLDYIFTVDIFNEGVDIPQINQVLMLRPTESPIIFIQQLGRGLRKVEGKDYVVVVDFIGNYDNNFMIPMALAGGYSKESHREFVFNPICPGSSTVSFTENVAKNIQKKLDQANYSESRMILKAYKQLKNKLNRIPAIKDFEEHDSIEILTLVAKYKSYYSFLKEKDKDYTQRFSDSEEQYLQYASSKYLCGKRPHELLMLKTILHNEENFVEKFRKDFKTLYPDLKYDDNTEECVVNQMVLNEKQRWWNGCKASPIIVFEKDKYYLSKDFEAAKKNQEFVDALDEIIEYGLDRYNKKFSTPYKHTSFKLYERYTYEDVCRGLDWDSNQVATNIGGYKYDRKTNTFPVFINYEKKEGISNSINYQDRFIDETRIVGISKGRRNLNSGDIQIIRDSVKNGTDIMLFVRKNKDDGESKEFYFLGKITPTGDFEEIERKETNDTVVEIGYSLETSVREDLYRYIIS